MNPTKEQIAEWRAKAYAATKGPWFSADSHKGRGSITRLAAVGPLAKCGIEIEPVVESMPYEHEGVGPNLNFIASAREAVPLLCDEVDRLRTALLEIAEWDCSIPENTGNPEYMPTLDRNLIIRWSQRALEGEAPDPGSVCSSLRTEVAMLRKQLSTLGRACLVRRVHYEWVALRGLIRKAAESEDSA